jgi:hypothetical protein
MVRDLGAAKTRSERFMVVPNQKISLARDYDPDYKDNFSNKEQVKDQLL